MFVCFMGWAKESKRERRMKNTHTHTQTERETRERKKRIEEKGKTIDTRTQSLNPRERVARGRWQKGVKQSKRQDRTYRTYRRPTEHSDKTIRPGQKAHRCTPFVKKQPYLCPC